MRKIKMGIALNLASYVNVSPFQFSGIEHKNSTAAKTSQIKSIRVF